MPDPKRRIPSPHARTLGPITPITLPTSTRGILVFGGSFDPPHLWHIRIAAAARRTLFPPSVALPGRGAWIVLVPTARSPNKASGPVASDRHRLAMLRLAAAELPDTIIWTDEIDRAARARRAGDDSPSYTVETLQRLRTELARRDIGSGPVRLLIGADQAAAFHRWRRPRAIIRLAEPAVVLRPPLSTPAKLAQSLRDSMAWTEPELRQWHARVIKVRVRNLSSTRARAAASTPTRNRNGTELGGVVTPEVAAYIVKHRLYLRLPSPPSI
jgi:nicotinate-nucleotide adenylyltransferase